LRHAQKQPRSVETGGKSSGSMRHWQPVAAMDRIASNPSRRSVLRGRPTRLTAGISGSTSAGRVLEVVEI
jgi:hypothetical protein